MATLRYPFIEISPGVIRPIIPVTVYNPATRLHLTYLAWIDSGADFCAFPSEAAIRIGHNLHLGIQAAPIAVGGQKIQSYLHQNLLIFNDTNRNTSSHRADIQFVEVPMLFPLLGLKGFFSHFKVILDYGQRQILLEEY